MMYVLIVIIGVSAFLAGYWFGLRKATRDYSAQIRDILVAALSSDFINGTDEDND